MMQPVVEASSPDAGRQELPARLDEVGQPAPMDGNDEALPVYSPSTRRDPDPRVEQLVLQMTEPAPEYSNFVPLPVS